MRVMQQEEELIPDMFLFPGQRLCKAVESHTAGRGTYTRNGFVYSCLAGQLHTAASENGRVR